MANKDGVTQLGITLAVQGIGKHDAFEFVTTAEKFAADVEALTQLSQAVRVTVRASWNYGQGKGVLGDWAGMAHPYGQTVPSYDERVAISRAITLGTRLEDGMESELSTLDLEEFLGSRATSQLTPYRRYADEVLAERKARQGEADRIEAAEPAQAEDYADEEAPDG